MQRPRRPVTGAIFTLCVLFAIGCLTLRPAPGEVWRIGRTPLTCLVCGDLGGADLLLNIALFVPLGMALHRFDRSLRSAVLTAFLVSLAIETLQYSVIVGRDATLGDLLANTTGAAAGWVLAARAGRLLQPTSRSARRLAIVATACWTLAYIVSAWALHPAPPPGMYWGQWAHHFAGRGRFEGQMLAAGLNGRPMPDGPLLASPSIRRSLASGEFQLTVDARAGRRGENDAPIFGLANASAGIFLEWRQSGRDYEFTVRSRAALLGLHSPELLLRNMAPTPPGTPLALIASWHQGMIMVAATSAGHQTRRQLVLSPSGNWAFVWPWKPDAGTSTNLIGAAWLALTLVGIGYWGGAAEGWMGERAERSGWVGIASAAVVGEMLWLGPRIFDLQPTSAADWLGAALGFLPGYLAGRYMPRARSASGP